jgi:hypothetical protein
VVVSSTLGGSKAEGSGSFGGSIMGSCGFISGTATGASTTLISVVGLISGVLAFQLEEKYYLL